MVVLVVLEAVVVGQRLEVLLLPGAGRVERVRRYDDAVLGLAVPSTADVAAVGRLHIGPVAEKEEPVLNLFEPVLKLMKSLLIEAYFRLVSNIC